MAVALARSPERLDALVCGATASYGLEDVEPRLLRYYLRNVPVPHVAEALGVTTHDIKYHTRKLLGRIGAKNVADMIRRLSALEEALANLAAEQIRASGLSRNYPAR